MSSTSVTPDGRPLESVEVWYECSSPQCMTHLYSIPALKKHLSENHPGEVFTFPDNLPPGALDGIITYFKGSTKNAGEKLPKSPSLMSNPQSDKGPVKCGTCHQNFTTQSNLNFHTKNSSQCRSAQVHHRLKVALGSHSLSKKSPESSDRTNCNETRSNVIYRKFRWFCSHCGKRFSIHYSLDRHLLVHTSEKPHKCDICLKTFGRSDNLAKHISSIHQNPKRLRNRKRDKVTDMPLKATSNGVQNEQPNSLSSSQVNSIEADNVPKRIDIQQQEKPVAAPLKSKPTIGGNKKKIKHKLRFQPPERNNYICGSCPYRGQSRKMLQKHLRLHEEGSNALVCSQCNQFLHPTRLKSHIMSAHQ